MKMFRVLIYPPKMCQTADAVNFPVFGLDWKMVCVMTSVCQPVQPRSCPWQVPECLPFLGAVKIFQTWHPKGYLWGEVTKVKRLKARCRYTGYGADDLASTHPHHFHTPQPRFQSHDPPWPSSFRMIHDSPQWSRSNLKVKASQSPHCMVVHLRGWFMSWPHNLHWSLLHFHIMWVCVDAIQCRSQCHCKEDTESRIVFSQQQKSYPVKFRLCMIVT